MAKGTCIVVENGELCGRPVNGRGLCGKHYQRWAKTGDPLGLKPRWRAAEERFWVKVDENGPVPDYAPHLGPCWIWTAFLGTGGYGNFRAGGGNSQAHRYAYELLVKPIPDGLELDHLCRVHACVNPAHLEPVTRKVNVIRGADGRLAERDGKCPNGHEMTPENTGEDRWHRRVCKACQRENQRRYQERKKKQAA